MRRVCGKSLYQEASAVRKLVTDEQVESAKDRAAKKAPSAQSD
jgi:hypothetical protein